MLTIIQFRGTSDAFLEGSYPSLEGSLNQAIDEYEGYLDSNPDYEPPSIPSAL